MTHTQLGRLNENDLCLEINKLVELKLNALERQYKANIEEADRKIADLEGQLRDK